MGTAFGLTTAVQNGGMATMPIAVGTIRDATGSYEVRCRSWPAFTNAFEALRMIARLVWQLPAHLLLP